MAPEKKVEKQIRSYLDKIGAWHVKIHGSAYMPSGTPDILSCIEGKFVAIEVKRNKGGKVSALQELKIKQIQNAGGIAFPANSLEVFMNELSRHDLI